ncbi:hypothetical protein C943_03739 [Mariniradius saccharolyticus AK6]|uniref:Uncharacterized protein n=1 Tax=Mariniradius saccharolyticus AK6 TaxID=1239962 RepID=M7XAR7_9BACT|nr:hypothetical protein C943_03739 [Mariniradius saccharolyticus AK6]
MPSSFQRATNSISFFGNSGFDLIVSIPLSERVINTIMLFIFCLFIIEDFMQAVYV